MNSLGKFFSTVMASAVMFGLASNAHADGHMGMNVPMIKSAVVLSGLENP